MTNRLIKKITYSDEVSNVSPSADTCPAHETVPKFTFMSFRCEARNLVFNKFRALRFLTYVRNDSFQYCDTLPHAGRVFQQPYGGFTLVEILIAIFILSLVMATVYVSYSGILKTSHQLEEEGAIYQMARISMDRMIKDLSSLQSSSGSFDLRAGKNKLSNREFHTLAFWSASHLAFGENESEGRPSEISYYVRQDEDPESFSLWRADVSGAKPNKEKNSEGGFIICKNIEAFRLTFYDSEGRETDSWDTSAAAGGDQTGKAPAVVKIELFLVNLNDREKPYKFMTKVFLPAAK